MNFEGGNLKSIKGNRSTKSTLSTVSAISSISATSAKSSTKLNHDAAATNNQTSENDIEELKSDHPFVISYHIYLNTIETLPPPCILQSVYDELGGYRDCVNKGPNNEKLPPVELKEGEEFYSWSHWKKCSLELTKNTWALNKFKQAAIKKYISLARNYLSQLGCPM